MGRRGTLHDSSPQRRRHRRTESASATIYEGNKDDSRRLDPVERLRLEGYGKRAFGKGRRAAPRGFIRREEALMNPSASAYSSRESSMEDRVRERYRDPGRRREQGVGPMNRKKRSDWKQRSSWDGGGEGPSNPEVIRG